MPTRRDIPYATLTLTIGHDRKLYYGASGREFDYGGAPGAATAHLVTYDLKTGKTQDLGEMVLEDGSRVFGTNAADTGRRRHHLHGGRGRSTSRSRASPSGAAASIGGAATTGWRC